VDVHSKAIGEKAFRRIAKLGFSTIGGSVPATREPSNNPQQNCCWSTCHRSRGGATGRCARLYGAVTYTGNHATQP